MQKIIPPSLCPSCDTKLEWVKDTLYCRNNDCPSRTHKAILHWAKTLKIKGLGPKSIEKLELSSIEDIYDLTIEFMEAALGSEKLALKLNLEIEKSKLASLNLTLPAFGIPLIGNSATQKLSSGLSNLNELTTEKVIQTGLGPKAAFNLVDWYNNKFQPYLQDALKDFNFEFEKINKPKITKGVVCISGKLKSFKTKAEAVEVLENLGYKVKSSLTKDVTILINEGGVDSAKTQKAREAGITIINDINKLLGEE